MKAVFISLAFLASCSFFISNFGGDEYSVIGMESDNISLLFSHNIGGETHPCGCRTFPLGGLPQIAGQMHELKATGSQLFYVDTGDTFFPASRLTIGMEESQRFAAKNLAKGLAMLGLKYHVPGEQDFSAGTEFYGEILKGSGITMLAANAAPGNPFPYKKWIVLERGPHKVFLVGLSDPKLLQPKAAAMFTEPTTALQNTLKELKAAGWDKNNPFHRLVLLSHSGYDQDEVWAKTFPEFDWIVGSHSQKFTRKPLFEGKTKIVQVESGNHYLGEVKFALNASKRSDSFALYEIHESLSEKLNPNPYTDFIEKHIQEMARLQEQEQSQQQQVPGQAMIRPYKDAKSCIECHQPQAEKWQSTAHSVAYATLINAKEEKNLSCVKCHSLGLGDKRGFSNSVDITTFDKDAHRTAYWNDIKKAFMGVKSIRQLPAKSVTKLSTSWMALDEKHGVKRQMANVQCLNCHNQHPDHPFHVDQERPTREQKLRAMKDRCVVCHNPDQSNDWYLKKENGLPGKIDQKLLAKKVKAIACPRLD